MVEENCIGLLQISADSGQPAHQLPFVQIPNYMSHKQVEQADDQEDRYLQYVLHIVVAVHGKNAIVNEHGHAVANTMSRKEGYDGVVHLGQVCIVY